MTPTTPARAWVPAVPKPNPDGQRMGQVRSALAQARLARATALAGVAAGRFTVENVLDQACAATEHPLRRLRLASLLTAQPGVGLRGAEKILTRVALLCGEPDLDRKLMTVSWLLDRRAGGKRYLAWVDAHTGKASPWPGWPFTPAPAVIGEVA